MAFDKIVGVDGTTYQFPSLVRSRIADNISAVGSVENLATISALGPALSAKSNTGHTHVPADITGLNLDSLEGIEIGVVGANGIALADKHTLQYEGSTSTWRNKLATGGVTVKDATPPTTAIVGDAWFDAADGSLYVYYRDIDDTYSWVQVQSNSALEGTILSRLGAVESDTAALNTSRGLIPISPSSITAVSGSASANDIGFVTFAGCSSIMFNGIFTSAYTKYLIHYEAENSATDSLLCRFSSGGAADTSALYNDQFFTGVDALTQVSRGTNSTRSNLNTTGASRKTVGQLIVSSPAQNVWTSISNKSQARNSETSASTIYNLSIESVFAGTTSFDGFQLLPNGSSTLTGTFQVFGFND